MQEDWQWYRRHPGLCPLGWVVVGMSMAWRKDLTAGGRFDLQPAYWQLTRTGMTLLELDDV